MPETLPDEIRHAVLIRAPAERVYDALTTAEGMDGWFTTGASIDARAGGAIVFRWREWGPDRYTGEDGGRVIEATRPSRFVFEWRPDRGGPPTTVDVSIEQRDDGTVVRLREHGYQNTPDGRERLLDCAAGWGEALTLLKFYAEHGISY